jgi:hypothetical protein
VHVCESLEIRSPGAARTCSGYARDRTIRPTSLKLRNPLLFGKIATDGKARGFDVFIRRKVVEHGKNFSGSKTPF